jgi:two-component system, OmpR family, sensor kinase
MSTPYSLRRRLVMALLVILLTGGLLAAAGQYWQAREEVSELFDQRLQLLANNLPPETLLARPPPPGLEESDDEIVIQIWSAAGQPLWRSGAEALPPAVAPGFSNITNAQGHWRSYARRMTDGSIVQVSQDLDARREIATATVLRLLVPVLVLVPVLSLLAGAIALRLLRPLQQLAAAMQGRRADQYDPVVLDAAPRELLPVLTALNELLARQARARQQQQDFLADVAHELRTPLAAVRLQAQHARITRDDDARVAALKALDAGVQRAARLASQLLALARSEATSRLAEPALLRLDNLLREVLAERHPLALQKQHDLGLGPADACMVCGDADALRSLFGNLVDNALQHTPAGGRIDAQLRVEGAIAEFTLTDSGPGIPAAMRQALFVRFVRHGQADRGGSGLGLAIVRAVVEQHAGSITLEDNPDGKGLCVRVRLPLPLPRVAGDQAPLL